MRPTAPPWNGLAATACAAMVLLVLVTRVPLAAPAAGASGDIGSELPQIRVSSITFSNDAPKEGQDVNITVTVHNNGTFPIANVSVTVAYDTTNITTVRDLVVPPGGNRTVEVRWKAVKFTHVMSAVPSIDGIPFTKAAMERTLAVAAKPIGNSYVVFAALVVVLLVLLAGVVAPGVWERMRGR